MRHFFVTVFGGLAVVLAVWVIFNYAGAASEVVSLALKRLGGASVASIIRYTANQEEDLVNNASIGLPDKGNRGVGAKSFIIKNLANGQIIDSRQADTMMPVASLSKLVTAVVARKVIEPAAHITITDEIIATYGNTAYFKSGETYRAEDLYYPLLMVSSNDAAEAFARYYGRKHFIEAMNDFTQSIGAYHSYFADPSGLSPESRSSASDMAIILDWIRKYDPDILAITQQKSKKIRDHLWENPTHFLNWSNFAGGKNGFIPEAGLTGAAIFTFGRNKTPYAVVVLGSENRDDDYVKLLAKIGE